MEMKNHRLNRELKTISVMIHLYCHDQHGSNKLCAQCKELLGYSCIRLERCQFQEGKTACTKCPVHCYKPIMRERVREVMRYAGPRMIYRHPVLAVLHLIDGLRKEPSNPIQHGG